MGPALPRWVFEGKPISYPAQGQVSQRDLLCGGSQRDAMRASPFLMLAFITRKAFRENFDDSECGCSGERTTRWTALPKPSTMRRAAQCILAKRIAVVDVEQGDAGRFDYLSLSQRATQQAGFLSKRGPKGDRVGLLTQNGMSTSICCWP